MHSIQIYSEDLQWKRAIHVPTSAGRLFVDVAEKEENFVFAATDEGLFIYAKSGEYTSIGH